MSTPCFEQIFGGVPLVSSLELYKDEQDFHLIGFDERTLFTTKLTSDSFTVGETPRSVSHCSFQEFTIDDDIITVFKWEEKSLILDCKGVIYQIPANIVDEDTADLFEDSFTDEGGGHVKNIGKLDGASDVKSAHLVRSGFLAVLHYRSDDVSLILSLFSLESFKAVQSVVIYKNALSSPYKIILEYVDPDDIEKEFVYSWFPHFNPNEPNRGYAFVLNCDEAMCSVQLGLDLLRVAFFFSWPSPCVFSSFRRPVIEDGVQHRNTLLLSFEDGAIVRLSRSGGEILHFTLSQMKCACYIHDTFFCSDYTDCHATCLNPVDGSCVLPLKGVISFCPLNNGTSRVLALTNYGGLYLLKSDVKCNDGKYLIPEMASFQETVNNISYLEELNSKISALDSSIKCLAAAVNEKNFRFRLQLQVVQIIADDHLFRVTCEMLIAGDDISPTIHAENWHVVLTVTSKAVTKMVHVQKLPCDFSTTQPLEVMARLKLPAVDTRDYVFKVKLISFVGEGKYRPTLLLGKIRLDVLSFLEPEHAILAHTASSAFTVPSLADLFKSQSRESFSEQGLNFVLEVPIKDELRATIIGKLLEKSQALWRVQFWDQTCSNSNLRLVVHGTKISVQLKNETVCISSDDISLALSMKHAILGITGSLSLKGLGEGITMEAENLLKNLELMEFSQNGPSFFDVFEIYRRKVRLINDRLYGTSTLIE